MLSLTHKRVVWLTVMLLSAGAPAAVIAQQDRGISGVVVGDDGVPIAAAEIVAGAPPRVSLTGRDGRFTIRAGDMDSIDIRVSAPGHAPTRLRVAPGSDPLRIVLTPTPLNLPGFQVTAAHGARDPLALTQSTSQLAGRSLEREQGSSLAETLRREPGVAVRFMGPAATMPVLRGLTGDRVLVLQDGRRSGDLAGSADDHGVTIDPLAAQRIEIVRGPATVMYGNNAMGGVVNVVSGDIPSSRTQSLQGVVAARTESAFPGAAGSARIVAPIAADLIVTARATGRSTDDMRMPRGFDGGQRLPNSDATSGGGALGIAHIGDHYTSGLVVRGHRFGYGLPLPAGADPVGLRGNRLEVGGRLEHTPRGGPVEVVSVDGSTQRYVHDEVDERGGDLLQRFRLDTRTVDLVARHRVAGEGAWGVSLLTRRYAAAGESALTPPADSRGVGLFVFQDLPITGGEGGMALLLGGRVDGYTVESRQTESFGPARRRSFRAASGAAGLRLPLAPGLTASLHAARSFRAPTVEELFSGSAHAGTGAVEFGNPDLRPEVGHALEASLRVRSTRMEARLSAHRNVIRDYVHLEAAGDTVVYGVPLPILRYTQSRATLQGLEASVEWAAMPTLVVGGMADYLHAGSADGTPLSYMPPPRLGLLLRWDDGRYNLGGDLHREFAQNRVGASDELPTPAHTIARLHAGIRIRAGGREHSITVRAENPTDSIHREATSRIKDFAPGPGRNLSVGYRLAF